VRVDGNPAAMMMPPWGPPAMPMATPMLNVRVDGLTFEYQLTEALCQFHTALSNPSPTRMVLGFLGHLHRVMKTRHSILGKLQLLLVPIVSPRADSGAPKAALSHRPPLGAVTEETT